MFTIRVIDRDSGLPAEDVVVSVSFSGFFGGHTEDVITDENGEAEFDADPGEGTVYVSRGGGMFSSSQTAYEGEIKGRKTVYID